VKMAYKLKTDLGQAIYRLRKCTVDPVIGIVKEIMGFRQFSLRGSYPVEASQIARAWGTFSNGTRLPPIPRTTLTQTVTSLTPLCPMSTTSSTNSEALAF
jgi:hypothetical protein